MLSVREIASGQVMPGGRSTPRGRGGSVEFCCCGGGIGTPFEGGRCWYPAGADFQYVSI